MSDTLATLRQALAPKQGMRRIPFPLESYQHPSVPLSAKRLLNLMSEGEPADARTQAALVPTPCLTPWLTVGTGPIRAICTDMPGVVYFISGTHLFGYRAVSPGDTNSALWDMGSVGAASPGGLDPSHAMIPTIAASTQNVVAVVPPNGFIAAADYGSIVNQLGGTFPGATSVSWLNGYFIFSATDPTPQQFFVSKLGDPANFDALDFASIESGSNAIVRVITHAGEIWVVGMSGFEVWYDSGDADFPFRRRQTGGVIERAAGTPRSIAQGDGSVFWLGLDGIVYRSVGYQAQRISTHAIEAIIAAAGWQTGCLGMSYTDRGHVFYVLTIAGPRTLVYDCSTKLWHDRASSADGSGGWLPVCLAPRNDPFGSTIAGDPVSGQTYLLDHNSDTDAGVTIARKVTFPPIYAGTHRAFCNRVEVEMEVGTAASNGPLTLDWSDDGGTNFTGFRTLNGGTVGALRTRAYTTRLGSFRQRVFRLEFSGRRTIYAADADISGGTGG